MNRAVVFTHLDHRHQLENPNAFGMFYKQRGAFFRSCLQCESVGVVFVYSSYGVEKCVKALFSQHNTCIPIDVLENEQRIYNALQLVLDRARNETGVADGPEFVFVGVRELACHLNRLLRTNPKLVDSFAHKGEFTYDSPKYVEAMIRLARARDFPEETIIRIDADVHVNEEAVKRLVEEAHRCRQNRGAQRFWWFSGCYSGNFPGDPVNEHAVRTHWLVTRATRRDPARFTLVKGGEHFLADIAEVGATQFDKHDQRPRQSLAASKLAGEWGGSKHRQHAQVISGAGLVTSFDAIFKLPPFTNAPAMVVWIDDHLKRLLHEAVGDILPSDIERVTDACLQQDRFPDGIQETDVARSPEYFE